MGSIRGHFPSGGFVLITTEPCLGFCAKMFVAAVYVPQNPSPDTGAGSGRVEGLRLIAKLLVIQPFRLHAACRCANLNVCPGWRVELCLVRRGSVEPRRLA